MKFKLFLLGLAALVQMSCSQTEVGNTPDSLNQLVSRKTAVPCPWRMA